MATKPTPKLSSKTDANYKTLLVAQAKIEAQIAAAAEKLEAEGKGETETVSPVDAKAAKAKAAAKVKAEDAAAKAARKDADAKAKAAKDEVAKSEEQRERDMDEAEVSEMRDMARKLNSLSKAMANYAADTKRTLMSRGALGVMLNNDLSPQLKAIPRLAGLHWTDVNSKNADCEAMKVLLTNIENHRKAYVDIYVTPQEDIGYKGGTKNASYKSWSDMRTLAKKLDGFAPPPRDPKPLVTKVKVDLTKLYRAGQVAGLSPKIDKAIADIGKILRDLGVDLSELTKSV